MINQNYPFSFHRLLQMYDRFFETLLSATTKEEFDQISLMMEQMQNRFNIEYQKFQNRSKQQQNQNEIDLKRITCVIEGKDQYFDYTHKSFTPYKNDSTVFTSKASLLDGMMLAQSILESIDLELSARIVPSE